MDNPTAITQGSTFFENREVKREMFGSLLWKEVHFATVFSLEKTEPTKKGLVMIECAIYNS